MTADCLIDTNGLVYAVRRGHPVIFPGSYGMELGKLAGDEGARSILNSAGDNLTEVEVHSLEIFQEGLKGQ